MRLRIIYDRAHRCRRHRGYLTIFRRHRGYLTIFRRHRGSPPQGADRSSSDDCPRRGQIALLLSSSNMALCAYAHKGEHSISAPFGGNRFAIFAITPIRPLRGRSAPFGAIAKRSSLTLRSAPFGGDRRSSGSCMICYLTVAILDAFGIECDIIDPEGSGRALPVAPEQGAAAERSAPFGGNLRS
jgi:hypothetical protein